MAFLVADIVTQLRRLEPALNEALLRLQQAQDTEALHDLRVCLRRIRSLLRLRRARAAPPPSAAARRHRVGQAHDAAA
ncbi:CHAD domain-containing protein [Serratia ureilytica]